MHNFKKVIGMSVLASILLMGCSATEPTASLAPTDSSAGVEGTAIETSAVAETTGVENVSDLSGYTLDEGFMPFSSITINGTEYAFPAAYSTLAEVFPLNAEIMGEFAPNGLYPGMEVASYVTSDDGATPIYPGITISVGNYYQDMSGGDTIAIEDGLVRHIIINTWGDEGTDFEIIIPGGGSLGMSVDEIVELYGEPSEDNIHDYEEGGCVYCYPVYSEADENRAIFTTFTFLNDQVVGIDLEWV